MIKFTAKTGDGRDLIMIGLSELNIEKLKQGMPIAIEGKDLGMPTLMVSIFYGKTEKDMYNELKAAGINMEHATIEMKAFKE